MTKVCSKCHIEKDASCFGKHKTGENGLHPYCKECRAIIHREFYEKNKEKIKATNKKYRELNPEKVKEMKERYFQSHREEINKNVQRYRNKNLEICKQRVATKTAEYKERWMVILRSMGMLHCARCGYDKYYEALDYHHIDPKTKIWNISYITKEPPIKEKVAELDKVVCLCANCHRELHGKRWDISELQQMRAQQGG